MTIKDFMTHQHRGCDQLLVLAEDALDKNDFEDAQKKYQDFKEETLKHFEMEEGCLFLLFEEKSGMTQGPTQVMRMEHMQARMLFNKLDEAMSQKESERFFSLSESLMILLQQHNAKEEQMLYTMIQSHLNADNDAILERLMSYGK
jgi:hemerythrin-like domain-containing protein